MTGNDAGSGNDRVDPDDAPAWTEEMFATAEIAVGGKIVRPGAWRSAGRPLIGEAAKQQVTLRIDPDVLAKFREGGPG